MIELDLTNRVSGNTFTVGVLQDEYTMAVENGTPKTTHLYDHRFIDYLVDMIMDRPRHKFATNIMVAGEPRTGKSTLAITMARRTDPKFGPSQVGFTLDEYMKIFASNPYADPKKGIIPQAIADESGFAMAAPKHAEREQVNLGLMFQVTPVVNTISYFVLPHKDFLLKSIRDTMIQYWIEVVTDKLVRGFAEVREGVHSKFSKDVYWKPVAAFTFDPAPKDAWWNEYFTRKVEFVDRIRNEPLSQQGASTREKDLVRQRNHAIRTMYLDAKKAGAPLSHKDIADRMGMPCSTVDTILNRV
jgi:hypothetical protein